jgi:hypothetical protein
MRNVAHIWDWINPHFLLSLDFVKSITCHCKSRRFGHQGTAQSLASDPPAFIVDNAQLSYI